MTAVEDRARTVCRALDEVEQLKAADRAVNAGKAAVASRAVRRVLESRLRETPPVPVSVAAELLSVSEPTVRAWIADGILEEATGRPQKVVFSSLYDVYHSVQELRAMGTDRNLRQALLARIDDKLTLEDASLQRSLRQMRAARPKRSKQKLHPRDAES